MSLHGSTRFIPSGVDWIGDIPSHWVVRALKWDTPVLRGASPRPIADPRYFDDNGEYAWVRIADVSASGTHLEETTQRLSALGASLSVKLKPGDLFLSIAGTVGKPCITRIKCCIHDGFVYFPRLSALPKFLYYVLASGRPYGGLGKLGTQLNLNTDTVGSIRMAFAPKSEQRAIADFLDRKTAAIDALIEKKERLIALLQEKRQALITQVVTKGLDPNIPMKDSGIEWLGEIPAHWQVMRVKHAMARIVDCPHSTPEYDEDGDYSAIRTADVDRGRLLLDQARRVRREIYLERVARMVPREGDILYSREGERFGMAALVPAQAALCLAQRMMIFRPEERHVSAFLMWLLNSDAVYQQVKQETVGATSPRINIPTIANAWIACAPRDEQQNISDALSAGLDLIDRTKAAVGRHIDLLREYRQAVIAAAVTGKLDIRSREAA